MGRVAHKDIVPYHLVSRQAAGVESSPVVIEGIVLNHVPVILVAACRIEGNPIVIIVDDIAVNPVVRPRDKDAY
jgi:hypothetical protein